MNQCFLCGNTESKFFLGKTTIGYGAEYDLLECPGCGVIYFDDMPSLEALLRFYSGSYFNFSPWHDLAKGNVYAKELNKIKSEGNFLDIGSALGYFISGIKQKSKWNVYGIEFSGEAVEYSTNMLGLNVKQGDIHNVNYPDNFFDYIHINNVLEHVRDPKALLLECRRTIKDDGYFFLSVPNGFNDSRSLIDFYNSEKIPARSMSGHLYFFPRQTLLKLFKETGFEVIQNKTGSIKRGMRNIGYLPKKKDWKKNYFPDTDPRSNIETGISVSTEKKHSDFYYKYRYVQSKLHDIPGLYNFGLDFIFLLRPG